MTINFTYLRISLYLKKIKYMKNKQPRNKNGSTKKISLNHINCTYGTTNETDCKAIWIEIGTWITINSNISVIDIPSMLETYKHNLNHFIRAHACNLHPNYLYSLIDLTWSDAIRFKSNKNNNFLMLEITVLLKKPLICFRKNLIIMKNMETLVKEIEEKMTSYDWLSLSTKHTKKVKSTLLQ